MKSPNNDMKTNHRQNEEFQQNQNTAMNNGFWDRPAEERAARMEWACERFGTGDFWDLSPEERGTAYED